MPARSVAGAPGGPERVLPCTLAVSVQWMWTEPEGGDQVGKELTDFSVVSFDCYGTLIDWEQGIWDALQPLLWSNECARIRRSDALEAFAEIESRLEATFPKKAYEAVLAAVHREFADRFDLESDLTMDQAFGDSVRHWPAFPDSADALRRLKKTHELVILSNVSRDGFAASNRKLGVTFDAVFTAEDIGSYKPSLKNFRYMLDRLQESRQVAPDQVLHTAQSLFHDHVPAKQMGLARAWIDRQDLTHGETWGATARVESRPEVDFTFPSLAAMADAIEGTVAGE